MIKECRWGIEGGTVSKVFWSVVVLVGEGCSVGSWGGCLR